MSEQSNSTTAKRKLDNNLASTLAAGAVGIFEDLDVVIVGGLGQILGQLERNLGENLVDVFTSLGRGFEEQAAVLLRVFLSLGLGHLTARLQITLVAGQTNDDVGAALSLKFLNPCLGAGERIGHSDIIDNESRRRTTVIHRSQTAITLLACRVPDFELDSVVVKRHGLRQKGGTNGRLLKLEEFILHKSLNAGGLADRSVTKQNKLEVECFLASCGAGHRDNKLTNSRKPNEDL